MSNPLRDRQKLKSKVTKVILKAISAMSRIEAESDHRFPALESELRYFRKKLELDFIKFFDDPILEVKS
jgi:hypothetical protein